MLAAGRKPRIDAGVLQSGALLELRQAQDANGSFQLSNMERIDGLHRRNCDRLFQLVGVMRRGGSGGRCHGGALIGGVLGRHARGRLVTLA